MPRTWTSIAYRLQAFEWVSRAQALLIAGEYENANEAIDEAFALIDEHGTREDAVFMAALTVAAELRSPR